MKDTVANAQVSSSSVSHVLNDSGPVAPERQRRVCDTVRLLEYARDESGVTEPTSSRDALVSVAVHGREVDTMTELETKVQWRESVCKPVDEA